VSNVSPGRRPLSSVVSRDAWEEELLEEYGRPISGWWSNFWTVVDMYDLEGDAAGGAVSTRGEPKPPVGRGRPGRVRSD